MKKLWFLHSDEVVSGPFTTDEVKAKLDQGEVSLESQIWWKGEREWVAIGHWASELPQILEAQKKPSGKPVWYAEKSGAQKGPLAKDELVEFLRTIDDVSNVRLWTAGLDKWTNIFEFNEILDELGVTRRQFPRAPIVGEVVLKYDEELIPAEAASVGAGGMGVRCQRMFNKGDKLQVVLKSPVLVSPVRCLATVAYIETNGYIGLTFDTIHAESKSTLVHYIRQFQESEGSPSQLAS